jgi:hypothetical protein
MVSYLSFYHKAVLRKSRTALIIYLVSVDLILLGLDR